MTSSALLFIPTENKAQRQLVLTWDRPRCAPGQGYDSPTVSQNMGDLLSSPASPHSIGWDPTESRVPPLCRLGPHRAPRLIAGVCLSRLYEQVPQAGWPQLLGAVEALRVPRFLGLRKHRPNLVFTLAEPLLACLSPDSRCVRTQGCWSETRLQDGGV